MLENGNTFQQGSKPPKRWVLPLRNENSNLFFGKSHQPTRKGATEGFSTLFIRVCLKWGCFYMVRSGQTDDEAGNMKISYLTAFGVPPALWLVAERPKAGVVGVDGRLWLAG